MSEATLTLESTVVVAGNGAAGKSQNAPGRAAEAGGGEAGGAGGMGEGGTVGVEVSGPGGAAGANPPAARAAGAASSRAPDPCGASGAAATRHCPQPTRTAPDRRSAGRGRDTGHSVRAARSGRAGSTAAAPRLDPARRREGTRTEPTRPAAGCPRSDRGMCSCPTRSARRSLRPHRVRPTGAVSAGERSRRAAPRPPRAPRPAVPWASLRAGRRSAPGRPSRRARHLRSARSSAPNHRGNADRAGSWSRPRR